MAKHRSLAGGLPAIFRLIISLDDHFELEFFGETGADPPTRSHAMTNPSDRKSKHLDKTLKKSIPLPQWLSRYRWQIVTIICLIILGFEVIEHIFEAAGDVIPFVFELLTFVILLLLVAVLVGDLVNNLNVEASLSRLLDQKHHLSLEMAKTQGWQDLLEIVYHFPASIGIDAETYLLLNSDNAAEFEINTSSTNARKSANELEFLRSEAFFQHCSACTFSGLHTFQECRFDTELANSIPANAYCLPLVYENKRIALLQLYPPAGGVLTKAQFDSLSNVGLEIGLALGSAMQRRTLSELRVANSAAATREEISRDLHDTLGQNLSYLHFKLDQFTREHAPEKLAEIQSDLVQMREISRESNELLRGTLLSLHPETQSRLTGLLKQHGKQVSERANFTFQFDSLGKSHPLTATTLRQIFYIYREALNNVERHAQATSVEVKLIWNPGNLEIQIHDDGRGFDITRLEVADHLGLSIMQERMEELGGEILFDSAVGKGTCISLNLPLLA